MEEVKRILVKAVIFALGFLVGIILTTGIYIYNEGLWILEIKRDQSRLEMSLKKIKIRELRALERAMRLYMEDLQQIFPPELVKLQEESDEQTGVHGQDVPQEER